MNRDPDKWTSLFRSADLVVSLLVIIVSLAAIILGVWCQFISECE